MLCRLLQPRCMCLFHVPSWSATCLDTDAHVLPILAPPPLSRLLHPPVTRKVLADSFCCPSSPKQSACRANFAPTSIRRDAKRCRSIEPTVNSGLNCGGQGSPKDTSHGDHNQGSRPDVEEARRRTMGARAGSLNHGTSTMKEVERRCSLPFCDATELRSL